MHQQATPPTPLSTVPTQEDIFATHQLIQPLIHRTPVLSSSSINAMTGARIYFKCENFQKIGAFKMRGASNAASRLTPEQRARGLATHSSGNHAQAVARAAQLFNVPAHIVMPENAPAIKVAAVQGYGAQITFCESTPEARVATLEEVVAQTDAHFIHPYDNYDVITGQATAALELHQDVNADLDIVMSPIGGGGLMSGTALYAHYCMPNTTVYGAEPFEVDDAYRSFHAGEIQYNETTNTIADGLRTPLSDKTFGIISQHVKEVLRVEEEAIVHAMRQVWERMKIIIEPSCAVPLAAVFAYPKRFKDKTVGIILTGGNVDLGKLPFV